MRRKNSINRFLMPLAATSLLAFSYCNKDKAMDKPIGPGEDEDPPKTEEPAPVDEEALAFPTAEGFGRKVTGGRGGKVIKVTNLNDAGSGSLRAAVEASGARIVVFDVSGTIELKSDLKIRNADITFAGQTAPGDGITLKDYPMVVAAENVIIRYMRFRMGGEAGVEGDALGGFESKNIIVDHCSISWSTDECASFYNNDNFTMQWCIISESLRLSTHVKGAHGYGAIWGGKDASFHHNLLAHHDSRNPRLGEREGQAYALTDRVDIRNNVFYNWGGNSTYGGEAMNVNIVNNYYKPGPATGNGVKGRIASFDKYLKNQDSPIYNIWGKFYVDGNVVEGNDEVTADNWNLGVANQFHGKYTDENAVRPEELLTEADIAAMKMEAPHPIGDNVRTETAEEAYESVLKYAGASLKRDAVDERILQTVRDGSYTADGSSGDSRSKNGLIDSPFDVGGWPELASKPAPKDSDHDGMPDAWEEAHQLDPQTPDANGRDLSTAYDNIEVYINSLVDDDQ